MKRLITLLCLFSLTVHAQNLLKNGNFDEGEKTASHWEFADRLTSFFIEEEGRGRVLMFNTQVQREQAITWLKTFRANPSLDAKPPKAIIVKRDSFGSVGAVEGVMLDSEFIEVIPGQNYKLSAEVKGVGGEAFVWIKGWMKHPKRDYDIDAYQTRLKAEGIQPNEWKHFEIGFNPTKRTPKIFKMKVRCYAFWPNGKYYFDNIKVEKITPEEMEVLKAKRAEVK
ncbi:MAG: hypothetical protein MK193_13815 [Lentisphaeria bacterium]|nr:hypothetical protein [Lentisphaeria bacterium]